MKNCFNVKKNNALCNKTASPKTVRAIDYLKEFQLFKKGIENYNLINKTLLGSSD